MKLIVTARRVKVLEDIKKEIEEKYKGTEVYPVKLDVSNPDEVRGFVKGLPQEVQNIDILVNNAYPPPHTSGRRICIVMVFLVVWSKEWIKWETLPKTILKS